MIVYISPSSGHHNGMLAISCLEAQSHFPSHVRCTLPLVAAHLWNGEKQRSWFPSPPMAWQDSLKMTPQMFYQAPVHHLLQVTPAVFLRKGQTRRQWEDERGSHVRSYSCAVPGYGSGHSSPGPPYGNQPSAHSRAREPWGVVGNKGMSPCPWGGGTASCHALCVSLGSLKVCHPLGWCRCTCQGGRSLWETEMQFPMGNRDAVFQICVNGSLSSGRQWTPWGIYSQAVPNKM